MPRLGRQRDTGFPPLILASSSPRRSDLLRAEGQPFEVVPSGVEESRQPEEDADGFARRLAVEKGLEVARRRPGRWVLAADTIVVLEGEVLGKPLDRTDAVRMLERLSGREHGVVTAFALVDPAGALVEECSVETRVTFRSLLPDEVHSYVESGEPFGKAGAYAIQGGAGAFVLSVRGSYANVVGLPIDEVRSALTRAGIWQGGNGK